jgi:hypothetical protein
VRARATQLLRLLPHTAEVERATASLPEISSGNKCTAYGPEPSDGLRRCGRMV